MRPSLTRGRRALGRVLGLGTIAVVGVLAVGSAVSAQSQPVPERTLRDLPASLAGLKLEKPETSTAFTADDLSPSAVVQSGGRVVVRLSGESGAEAFSKG